MQKELFTWQLIFESLRQQLSVMLLYVIESNGSSPGRQGFLMAVNQTGEISGSLGGGIMEHKFVELAKRKLLEKDSKPSLHQQIHNKAALQNQSGMICSGEQTILMYPLTVADKATVGDLISSLKNLKNGTLTLSLKKISFSADVPFDNYSLTSDKEGFLLKVKTGYRQQLFIIGAGHCSLAFSKLMSSMDFYITLFENRPALNTLEQNNFVHEKIHLNDYSEVGNFIDEGINRYVVIMTNGYRDDDKALRALINKDFTYIGILGSKKKIEQMFASYENEGIQPGLINRIHAPAGIAIKSQTPDEIAISIAAEIISVKNARLK